MSSNRPEHVRVTRTRREYVRDAFCGFGSLALASILHQHQARAGAFNPLNARPAHKPARARSVIFLFMAGGPRHLSNLDPPSMLNEPHSQPPPGEISPTN